MTINTVTATPSRILECIIAQAKSPVLRNFSPYIWGRPGIGKSEIMAQAAEALDYHLIDLRLTRMDSTDLTGLPYLHEESKKTIYYLPEFLPTQEMIDDWGRSGAIIFLDELSAAEPRLQASAYELILDRRIGKYKLPDNVMVAAAGNRIEDGAIAYDLTSALSDRFLHYNCTASPQDWLKWANKNEIHATVKSFIQARPDFLTEGFAGVANTDDKIGPSPRSWKRVSDLMFEVEDETLRKIMIPGIIGQASAQEFFFVVEEIAGLAPMSEYIKLGNAKDDKGLEALLPNSVAGLFGLSYSLPAYCENESDVIGACYVFHAMANVEDDKQRPELLCSSIISLYMRAQKLGGKVMRALSRSAAYKEMSKIHIAAFAEIENM